MGRTWIRLRGCGKVGDGPIVNCMKRGGLVDGDGMGWRTPQSPPHLINGPISGAEETGRKRDRVHYRPDIKLLLVSARWAQRRIQSWQCRLQTASHRGAGKFVNVICFQYSIFSQYSSFFSMCQNFAFSTVQQICKVTFLCHNFLSHLRFQEYLSTIIERGVRISFSIFTFSFASPHLGTFPRVWFQLKIISGVRLSPREVISVESDSSAAIFLPTS